MLQLQHPFLYLNLIVQSAQKQRGKLCVLVKVLFWKKFRKYCWLLSTVRCIVSKVAEHGNNKSMKLRWVLRAFVERAKTKSKKVEKSCWQIEQHMIFYQGCWCGKPISKTTWTLITKQYKHASSLKNICKSLKFFYELDWMRKRLISVWKDGS